MSKRFFNRFVPFFVIAALVLAGCGEIDKSDDVPGAPPLNPPPTGSTVVNSLDVFATTPALVADGQSQTAIRATVTNENNSPLANRVVTFTTTSGILTADSAVSNANGIAQVSLTSSPNAGLATVVASVEGFNQLVQVQFVAGEPSAQTSTLIANPVSLLADGTSEAKVTVILRDGNSNLVSGRQVTLLTTLGSVANSFLTTDVQGRAEFTLVAPSSPGDSQLSLLEYPGVTGAMSFGTLASGQPANIIITSTMAQVSVAGVGQPETLNFIVEVFDDSGTLIPDPPVGLNNLRVRFLTQPNGGERVAGTSAAGTVVSTTNNSWVLVRTVDGRGALNMHSGTLPGVVEIEAEALQDDGNPFVPPVKGIISQLSIASGPPHTIVLSAPHSASVENVGGGVYRRTGRAIVTDRYGNTVPEGTTINLGLLDSIIAMGNTGAVSADSGTLTDTSRAGAQGFDQAWITRNNTQRSIQMNDRVLLLSAPAADKGRFVALSPAEQSIIVQRDYVSSGTGLSYAIGASLLGGSIAGEAVGTAVASNGVAPFEVTYPANPSALGIGCLSYGTPGDVTTYSDDMRFPVGQRKSGQVLVIASSSDDSATTIDLGQFCFGHVNGETFDLVFPETLSESRAVNLRLRDGGDGVLLPFKTILTNVVYINRSAGFAVNVGPAVTNSNGVADVEVTIAGAESGDAATITFRHNDAEAEVAVNIP